MNIQEARKICQEFANTHKIVFDDEGECGLGRLCVGFRHGDNWIDHNPHSSEPPYDPIKGLQCDGTWPPDGVDAYHKHNCLAVLGRGDEAIIQLAQWTKSMQSKGTVTIEDFDTGAEEIQALIDGLIGCAVMVR